MCEWYELVNNPTLLRDCLSASDSIRVDIMQFTGLKDKHGKEIYEGDIVERNASNGRGNVRGVIIFLEGEFRIEWHGKGQWNGILHIHAKDCEITGNIHSNPELLK